MKLQLYFLPYHMKSMAVKELQNALGGTKIAPDGYYSFGKDHLVVNWGHGGNPYWDYTVAGISGRSPRLLNHWTNVHNAVNKIRAFKIFKEAGVPTPDWSTSYQQALDWVTAGKTVFCRTKVASMEGRGIVIAKNKGDLVEAKLYTKLFSKDKEYRVHVFNGKVIDFVQKKLRKGYEQIVGRDEYVRNTANGWIFARGGVVLPDGAGDVAIAAINALGLDFGAVDLAANTSGKVVVFEVNTAPGLEGTTITRYTQAIQNYLNELEKN